MPPTLPPSVHTTWLLSPSIRRLNFLLLSCYLGAIGNGYTSTLITNLLANPRWPRDIHGLSDPKLLGLVTAAHSLGSIAAFFPAPWLADKYGRRAGIMLGNAGMIAGFAGQVFCSTFAQFLGLRLIVGFAAIINTISSAALLTELAHPRQRAVAGALFNTFYFVGSITAAWTAYGALGIRGSWSWKVPVAVQAVWAVAQVVFVCVCPESPRWLVRKGERERARAIMVKYHANGDEGDMLIADEFEKMCASAGAEARSNSTSWLVLCATPGNRKRLVLSVVIGVATQWVGNGIISFYLAPVLQTVGITNTLQQQGINGGLQIYNWILACGAALLSEKAGRRRMFLTSAGTMLVFMVLVTICSALYSSTRSVAAGYAVIVFLFLFLGGYVIGLTPIPILYVNEIWPSHIRTKGTSVFWVSQSVAICFNQFVNPVALERIAWRYYLVYVAVLIFVIGFMFFYVPETKGLSLEEVGSIFD
ncbi:general substrate transporter, partial [Ophiobolus disseminans]